VLGAPAHAFVVRLPEGDVRAWDWGEGPTVLLVHGWNGDAAQMTPFVKPLVDAGFYVVAFDHLGHGLSSGNRASLVRMANTVNAIGRRVGPLAGVIAHSLGAPAATLAMEQGLGVKRTVFIAPPNDPSRYFKRLTAMLGLSQALAAGAAARLESRLGRTFASLDFRRISAAMESRLLVLHDLDDAEVPWSEGAAIAEAWPNARLTTLHGLGHVRPLRDARVIAEAVSFLSTPKLRSNRQSA
jgi:pimeloyl-ACP methyl ester carboxylesterase